MHRSHRQFVSAVLGLVTLGCLGVSLAGCQLGSNRQRLVGAGLDRCIWVTRWDYRNQDDIRRIMEDVASAGFDSVMFQVRGDGTVHWESVVELWAARYGHRNPGFDPLGIAVEEAARHGLAVHAWVNVMPGAGGKRMPSDPRHLWRARPEWFLMDRNGVREDFAGGGYMHLNPARPGVRRYLADLCGEIVSRYPVAGVHLDYIRFPDRGVGRISRRPLTRPKDRDTVAAFHADHPGVSTEGPVYEQWLRQQVTATVAGIRTTMRQARRDALLTAAVWSDPLRARDRVLQDWSDWIRSGLIDAVFPMNYTEEMDTFRSRLDADLAGAGGGPVVPVVAAYLQSTPAGVVQQMDAARAAGAYGVGVFAYDTLFGQRQSTDPAMQAALRRRVQVWNTPAPR